MRYSEGYRNWAGVAETRGSASDRERAALTAAKIRDNHSGSAADRRELARMERIANGPVWISTEPDDGRLKQRGSLPAALPATRGSEQPTGKLDRKTLERITAECFELGKRAAEADWEWDDLCEDPRPGPADPTMLAHSERHARHYRKLVDAWTNGYRARACLVSADEAGRAKGCGRPAEGL